MFDRRRDDVSSGVCDDVISVTSLEESSASSSSCTVDSFSSETASTLADTCLIPSYSQALLMDARTLTDHQTTGHRHQHQYVQWRHGRYSSQLRRVQSCLTVVHRDDDDDDDDVVYDVKPSPSLATHLCKPDRRAAILMTSRPPSYHTAMCHVTTHRLAPPSSDHIGYGAAAT